MARAIRWAALGLAALVLSACANPSVVRVNSAGIESAGVRVIYVPRFEGRPDFVEESTDLFMAELETRVAARVVQGNALRQEGPDVLAGGNIADTDLAIAAAKQVNADVVILGKVTSHSTGSTLNGFATVRVIDVDTGAVLASFHRPSGLLIANSEHHAVMSATKRAAQDVAGALGGR